MGDLLKDLREIASTAFQGTGAVRCAAWSGIMMFLSLVIGCFDATHGVHVMLVAFWFMGAGEIIDRGKRD